mmetsp:Transcript_119513/g.283745  ORF Transcript_119513/g.283745 Transcript_119513/m.283745 type:complete len:251 (+) Transcript_119513:328-1080(+)
MRSTLVSRFHMQKMHVWVSRSIQYTARSQARKAEALFLCRKHLTFSLLEFSAAASSASRFSTRMASCQDWRDCCKSPLSLEPHIRVSTALAPSVCFAKKAENLALDSWTAWSTSRCVFSMAWKSSQALKQKSLMPSMWFSVMRLSTCLAFMEETCEKPWSFCRRSSTCPATDLLSLLLAASSMIAAKQEPSKDSSLSLMPVSMMENTRLFCDALYSSSLCDAAFFFSSHSFLSSFSRCCVFRWSFHPRKL